MPVANAACELIGSVDSDAFSWSSCDSLAPVHGVSVEGIHIHRVQLECIIVDKQRNIYSRNTPRLGKPAQLLTIIPQLPPLFRQTLWYFQKWTTLWYSEDLADTLDDLHLCACQKGHKHKVARGKGTNKDWISA